VRAAQRASLLIFARIDHAANAQKLGEDLRPTELLILGHPRGGTPLMMDRQTGGDRSPGQGARMAGRSRREAIERTISVMAIFLRRGGKLTS
jgi:hypothetical protein